MPKIIPDIQKKLLDAASEAFRVNGYASVEMKELAKSMGVSVGTLYNYYPSKFDLFFAVLIYWHDILSTKLENKLNGPENPRIKLREVLITLYDNVENYIGMWQEFQNSDACDKKSKKRMSSFHQIKDRNTIFYTHVAQLLLEIWKDRPEALNLINTDSERSVHAFITPIFQIIYHYPESKEDNRIWFNRWLDFLLPLE